MHIHWPDQPVGPIGNGECEANKPVRIKVGVWDCWKALAVAHVGVVTLLKTLAMQSMILDLSDRTLAAPGVVLSLGATGVS